MIVQAIGGSEDGVPVRPTMTDQRPTDAIVPLVPRLPTDAEPETRTRVPKADGGLPVPTTEVPLVPDVS